MQKVEYVTKDKKQGQKYVLQDGDIITSKYKEPKATKLGKYMNYSLAVLEEYAYVQLTKGQYEKLLKLGDITNKKIVAYKYTNDFGDQIGVNLFGEKSPKSSN